MSTGNPDDQHRQHEHSHGGDQEQRSSAPPGENHSDAGASQPPTKKQKRNGRHVSTACDVCRDRKLRCDGCQPTCKRCRDRSLVCTYTKEDGRRNRADEGSLRKRVTTLIDLLASRSELMPPVQGQSVPSQQGFAVPGPTGATQQAFPDLSGGTNIFPILPPGLPHDMSFFENPSVASTSIEPPQELNKSHGVIANVPAQQSNQVDGSSASSSTQGTSPLPDPATPTASITGSVAPGTTSQSDRLKRNDLGSLMQFGPTSLWSYARDTSKPSSSTPSAIELRSGDWIDWARNLPADLDITKAVHDAALSVFGAYYAPWCMLVDMPAFLRDLDTCNLVSRVPRGPVPPKKTVDYSPLLHCCVLHMGLHIGRDRWPDMAASMGKAFHAHCAPLILEENESPLTSSPKSLALFASCLNLRRDHSASSTGYIYFGMAFAAIQALGVNLVCDHLVSNGQISEQERDHRYSTYWTMHQQDLLRAIAAGRPAMLARPTRIPFPAIDKNTDNAIWHCATDQRPNCRANGLRAMTSTIQHWNARLHCLLRKVTETSLYSVDVGSQNCDERVVSLSLELDAWYQAQPFAIPSDYPLPHLLVMHMVYHLTQMYLFRPFYRAELAGMSLTPAQRSDAAAYATLKLLQLYETEHGLRNGVATLRVPIIFGTATILLLALASNPVPSPYRQEHLKKLNETGSYMDLLSHTWVEARRGLEIINALRAEWLPETIAEDANLPLADVVVPSTDEPSELPRELHEWLLNANDFDFLL